MPPKFMTSRLRVCTIVGTRPEIIRLSRVLAALDRHFDHTLVHTGQNYDFELNEVFFAELGLRAPDRFLEAVGKTPMATIARIIERVDESLADLRPEAVLILGDTNSALAAIAAKRRHIPIFHMEAGNRCFDMRVPEEINRRIVDHVADINLPYSQIAREYLLREGLRPDLVIVTGSPMREVLTHYRSLIDASTVLERLDLRENEYFVVSCHREENVDDPEHFAALVETLNGVAALYHFPIIFSAHPRTRARLTGSVPDLNPLVRIEKPFGLPDYVHLQTHARAVLSDSGTITEESSILNFPAINLRHTHERPEGMEEAVVPMTGLSAERVQQALVLVSTQGRAEARTLRLVDDYAADNVSEKVVRIILSYTDYVRRVVWGQRV